MPRAFLCDFDGTVSPEDIGAAFVRRFSPGRDAERAALLARWRAGGMGHRALTEAECALVTAHADEALAFTRGFRLDPTFAPFVREALARGDAVMVVSEGFDFYVEDQLARAGLADLPRAANRIRFDGARLHPEFPFAADGCGACGNCKAQHVRGYHARGFDTVLVGDGYSDRCGARAAGRVLARGGLLAWCAAERVAAEPFESFADVAAWARRPMPGAEAARGRAGGPA
jgi:HAD superfamily phosphoserine phosphatase-like hydrolase